MPTVCNNVSEIDVATPRHVQLGRVEYPPGGTLGPRTQRDVQLVMIDHGSLRLRRDGRWVDVAPGQVALQWPGIEEFYAFDAHATTTHRWVVLRYDDRTATKDWLARQRRGSPVVRGETPAMRQLFDTAMAMSRHDEPAADAATAHLASAFLAAFLTPDTPLAEHHAAPPLPAPLNAMLTLVDERLHEPLTLNDLARAASVTPAHLIRICRAALGDTPVALLWQRRLRRGRDLIERTGLSVAEVAYAVGFSSPYHFSRRFREAYGSSPRAHRRAAWNKDAA